MRILALWVHNYHSGSTTERFLKPLLALGHEVDIIPLEDPAVDFKVLQAVESKKYDFLLHLPYPNTIRPEIIRHISDKTEVKTIVWQGDDEWGFSLKTDNPFHPLNLAKLHNYVITADFEAIKKYQGIGIEAILGQWGYSASDWKPKKCKKEFDIYFCGSKTPERDYFLRAIRDEGINIKIEGPGYSIKKVELQDMIQGYRKSKIGINFVSGKKGDFPYKQVKARNFEIPAVGTFHLSEHCEALTRFFAPGFSIETFIKIPDMLKKIHFYLDNEEKREEIAKNGMEINKAYSYEKIFTFSFHEIEERNCVEA